MFTRAFGYGKFAALFLLVNGSSSFADSYPFNDGNQLLEICDYGREQNEMNCISYVAGIAELSLALYPQCQPRKSLTFVLDVLSEAQKISRGMSKDALASSHAATLVFEAVTKLVVCTEQVAPNATPSGPNDPRCQKGIEALSDQWLDRFQKQALLEMLRNRGCLK